MTSARPFLIGDKWCHTDTHEPVRNPFDGSVIAEVCQAGKKEIAEAVERSCAAFSTMKTLSGYKKAKGLSQIASAHWTIGGMNSPVPFVQNLANPSRMLGVRSIEPLKRSASRAKRRLAFQAKSFLWTSAQALKDIQEVSVVFPSGLSLASRHSISRSTLLRIKWPRALLPATPSSSNQLHRPHLTSLLLGEVILESEFPAGALNILPCSNTLAEQLVQDSRFQALSFTGSVDVGWMLKKKVGKQRVALELGGNAAVVIEPDADLEVVAQRCVTGGFRYSGQTCVSIQRIFAQQSIYESFLEIFTQKVRNLPAGDPIKEETVIGPLITEAAAERVETWVKDAVAQGATIQTGGTREGSVMTPTVLTNVTNRMKVSCAKSLDQW